jgi:sortase A
MLQRISARLLSATKEDGQAMNRTMRTLCIVLLILIGIGLFAYPMLSNYLFSRNASTITQEYDKVVEEADDETLAKAWAQAVAYNASLEGNPVKDPFLKDSGMVMAENYAQVLDLAGQGIMGYVSIPKIGVRLSIYHGTAESVLQKGVGHLEGSSLPTGGLNNHSVLTGHTGLAHAKMFTDLRVIAEGDLFYLHILDRVLAYEVDQIKVVLPHEISELRRAPGKDYCTLVTCTPYGVNTHRLFVRGIRTEYVPEIEEQQIRDSRPSAQWFTEWNMIIGLAIGAVAAVIIIFVALYKRKKKKERRRYWWWQIEDEKGSP